MLRYDLCMRNKIRQPNRKTSPFTREREQSEASSRENPVAEVTNLHDFATKSASTKSSPVQDLIRLLVREVRRERLTYDQLRYVFKAVRIRCELEAASKGQKLYELLTQEELDRFMGVVESPTHRLMWETLLGTGLRVSELCALEVKRLDFKGNSLFVAGGKGDKDRIVIVGTLLLQKLALYLENRHNRYVFESTRRTRFSPRRIQQLCSKYKSLAGIEKPFTVHGFRHIWNTRLAEAGVNRERRAILAGHSDERTQTVYTHLSAGGLRSEIVEILDKLDRSRR